MEIAEGQGNVQLPVRLDPGFDLLRTTDLGRMIQKWGPLPMQYLQELAKTKYIYAYIGMEDLTMYPLLLPGSFIQVDEERSRVEEKKWRSELERPIYFVETREGHVCCWCSVRRGEIILQSHPLSPVPARILKHPQDAEVVPIMRVLPNVLAGEHQVFPDSLLQSGVELIAISRSVRGLHAGDEV